MKTRCAISTISYNSKEFLINVLNDLYNRMVISRWYFMYHFKEEDESKDHIHLWIMPNGTLNTMVLDKEFFEYDGIHEKPLRCRDWHSSDLDNWILYTMHHKEYLWIEKHQTRKYHYSYDDFIVSSDIDFEDDFRQAMKGSAFAIKLQQNQIINANLDNPAVLFTNGTLPWNMAGNINAYKYMETHYCIPEGTNRNGKRGHEGE